MGPAHTFESVSRRPPDVEDYIDMLRRYRSWIVGPTFAGLVIATVVAFLWPDTYISTAVMRITPQQVPDKLVPTVVTTQMAERLQQLQTDILSRTSLAEIIQKPSLDLYKKERAKLPMEDIVQDMRNKYIKIIPLADTSGSGGRRVASAFAISFAYVDRYKAQAVVRELVTKFTETNVTVQRNQASLTTNFLKDELKSAKERMDKLDEDIIRFKQANMGRLPEQASANSQALQTYSLQLMNANQQISRVGQEKLLLESDLKAYKNQENAASANLTETVAGSTTGPVTMQNTRLAAMNASIGDLKVQLAAMKQNFGSNHPDVARLDAQIQTLEQQRDDLEKRESAAMVVTPGTTTPSRVVTNPIVQRQIEDLRGMAESTRSRLVAKDMELAELNRQRTEMEKQIALYQGRIESAPLNEQQYNAMIREFNLAKQEYEDMVKRHDASETAQSLEEHKAGENLEVLDPATLPEQPSEPNRLAWAGIGTAMGLGLGVMLAAAQEVRNTSLKNLKDVRAYTNMPVLSSIPLLENALLVRRKRRLVWLAWSSAVLIGFILMGGAVYYRMSGV
jgi:polysaccharide chain length determinant protein (PEP-CTERM system associated)